MTSRKQVLTISGPVLKWARITLFGGKIEEATIKLGITKEELTQLETTNPTISLSRLKKISKVYKRNISVLLLKTPPISQQTPKFRKLPDVENATFQQTTFLSIRQAQEVQNATIYLLDEKQNIFIQQLQKYSYDPELLASKTIEFLGINEDIRFKSKTSREQLSIWKRLLEAKGVLVLELSYDLADSRAFTLFHPAAPVIALNSKDTDNARIFSLFHELGHLVLGQTDIDESFDLDTKNNYKDEKFCNTFSASLLVPNNLLKEIAKGIRCYEDNNVKEIANVFKVSISVIWRKLHDNNLITFKQFNKIRHKLSTFEAFSQPIKREFKANKNTHLYIKIKRKSEFFINEVFDAFNQNKISYYDVLNYIGIKAETLPKLQRLMFT